MKLRGLFVTAGGFSLVNEQLKSALRSSAPDFEWTYFDAARDTFTDRPLAKLACHLLAAVQFAPIIARHRIPPRDLMVRLPYFQRCLTRALLTASRGVNFSLQTQSLYDARTEDRPNFLYTDHTHLANKRYDPPRPTWPVSDAWLRMEKSLYRNARVSFVTSSFAGTSIIEDYGVPGDRVAVVNSGCNTELPTSIPPRDRPSRRIIFVGVEWERKGGPVLVEAFNAVRRRFPEASLDIVGCAPFPSRPGIVVHGRVDREAVPRFLEQADIFCLASTAEPSAVALVEASAYALPVVATRVGGTPERVLDGVTGILVEPSDAEALAQALCHLMANSELAWEMGSRGHEFALHEFTWTAVADKITSRLREELQ